MKPGVHLERVVKHFGPVVALDGVSLSADPGRIHVIVGRNGAGKSTLLRVLATAVIPDGGRATVDGFDVVRHAGEVRTRTGSVIGDERSHFWRLTGRQNLRFFAALRGFDRRAAQHAVSGALCAVGLSEAADRRVDRYSSGMRSKLAIARALLGSPTVLLLDEPTRSLDPAAGDAVRALIRDITQDRGTTVLLSTHDLHEAASLADIVTVLDRGEVVAHGSGSLSADEIKEAFPVAAS